MKKLLFCLLFLGSSIAGFAQFEKNTWFVNPSFTGMDLSFNKEHKTHFGLEASGGAFVMDNVAVILTLGGDYQKNQNNTTTVGVGGRYYLDDKGIYFGLGLRYNAYSSSSNDFGAGLEVGYAYFLNKTITLEPAVYYNQSFNHHKLYSRFGIKLGLGVYF